MDPNLKQAVLGAGNIQTPTSPLGDFPELRQLYQVDFQMPQVMGAANAIVGGAEEAERAAAAGRAAAERARKAKEEAALAIKDPKRYERVKKKDGGYDFFFTDPSGKRQQVDIATLINNTGDDREKWLSGSENPIDVQYLDEQNTVRDFMTAVTTKDRDKIDEYKQRALKESNVDLSPYADKEGGLDALIKQFYTKYRRYYTSDWGASPGAPLIPKGSSIDYIPGAGGASTGAGGKRRGLQ